MRPLVFIKLGGSCITKKDTPYTIDQQNIQKVQNYLPCFIAKHKEYSFVLGNGAGSFGHYAVLEHQMQKGIQQESHVQGLCAVQDSVAYLNGVVRKSLLEKNLPVCSLHPSSFLTSSDGIIASCCTTGFLGFVDKGIIPLVYGDIVYDARRGAQIFSTEDVFSVCIDAYHKQNGKVSKIILISDVPGVLDDRKKVIPQITPESYLQMKNNLYMPKGYDVTGGMRHKIEQALKYAKKGIQTHIMALEDLATIGCGEEKGTIVRCFDA